MKIRRLWPGEEMFTINIFIMGQFKMKTSFNMLLYICGWWLMRSAIGQLLELRQLMKSEVRLWDGLTTWTLFSPSIMTGNGAKKKK